MNSPSDADLTKKELAPISVDGISAVKIGTLIWIVALAISILFKEWFVTNGISEAPAVCCAGIALGLLGQIYTRRRAKRISSSN